MLILHTSGPYISLEVSRHLEEFYDICTSWPCLDRHVDVSQRSIDLVLFQVLGEFDQLVLRCLVESLPSLVRFRKGVSLPGGLFTVGGTAGSIAYSELIVDVPKGVGQVREIDVITSATNDIVAEYAGDSAIEANATEIFCLNDFLFAGIKPETCDSGT